MGEKKCASKRKVQQYFVGKNVQFIYTDINIWNDKHEVKNETMVRTSHYVSLDFL
jgi:hypothetical protein